MYGTGVQRTSFAQSWVSPVVFTIVICTTIAALTDYSTQHDAAHDAYDSMKSVILQQITLPEYQCPLHTICDGPAIDNCNWRSCNARCLTAAASCTVVSFANPNEYNFENGVLRANPSCNVHVVNRMLIWPWGKPLGVHVHSMQLASSAAEQHDGVDAAHDAHSFNLLQPIITEKINHTTGDIFILRFDCNIHEPRLIVDGLQALRNRNVNVHQVFIRVHFRNAPVQEWQHIFHEMVNLSYNLFNREIPAGVAPSQQIIDYSWVLQGTTCAMLHH